jgi:WD40 repeat protein
MNTVDSGQDPFDRVAEAFLAEYRAGARPAVNDYARRHPELADQIRSLFPALLELEAGSPWPSPHEAATLSPGSPAPAEAARPEVPGYEVLEELGRGGMGVVYRARQVGLNRVVALKVILAGPHAGEAELARFRAEAEAVARLSHPNVVQIHEVGEHGGLPFFSLEYVAGGSLADRLDGTPWPARRAAALVETLARAVQAAHARGVVHRDLKPANVLLAADGTPKVTDFGLAKRLDVAKGQTQSGAVVGTPSYMAPEQATGKGKEVGPLADVYALGAILYELLTGRPPFRAETPLDTILQVATADPVPARRLQPGVPRDLETVCLKCLHKEPARRYGNARDLADDLRRFQAGEPVRARPVGPAERLGRWCRRNPALAVATAGFTVALLAGQATTSWQWWQASRERRRADQARGDAERQAEHARRLQATAEEKADESHRRLVQQYVATGERLAEDGDPCSALAWLAEALDLDRGDADREQAHRIALHSLIRQAPQLVDVWFLPELANPGRAASPDGRRLLAVSDAGLARVWDADSHQPLSPPMQEAGAVRFAAFGPDGRLVLTANANHEARVWDAETGRPVTKVFAVGRPLMDAALTADGRRVVTLAEDGRARLWDSDTGQALPGLDAHAGPVRGVSFSPDGGRVVSVGDDQKAYLWEAATGQLVTPLSHPGQVWHASFSPDGRRLATAGSAPPPGGGQVCLWSSDQGEPRGTLQQLSCLRASFSPDGKQVLTVAPPTGVRLTPVAGGANAVELPHQGIVYLAGFSPDGASVLTATQDMTVRLWEAATGRLRAPPIRHGALVWHASFSPDGRRWRTAGQDGVVRTWRTAGSGGPTRTLTHAPYIQALALSPDGRRAVTGGMDKSARIWDLGTGKELFRLPHRDAVWAVAYSPDGGLVATASTGGTAQVWDAQTWARVSGTRLHWPKAGGTGGVAFSRDSRYVVAWSGALGGRGEARVWEARTGQPAGPLLEQPRSILTAEISPDDNRRVLTGGESGVLVWDLEKGAGPFELGRKNQGAFAAAYSPDGTRLVTGNVDGTARVWDAATGEPRSPPLPHGGVLYRVAFSPDGGRVLTAGEDQLVSVWHAATGERLTPPLRHRSRVVDAGFSADGRFIITGCQEGCRGWEAATGRLLTVPLPPRRVSGWGRAALTPDNRRLVTLDHEYVHVWDNLLDAGDEPAEELVLRARLIAGQRVDASGGLMPLEPAALRDAWAALRR